MIKREALPKRLPPGGKHITFRESEKFHPPQADFTFLRSKNISLRSQAEACGRSKVRTGTVYAQHAAEL